jgi:hypothetical protein
MKSLITLIMVSLSIISTSAHSQQGTKNNSQADLYFKNIATRLDKSKAASCVAAANLGAIRAKNSGMSKETVNYFMDRFSLWLGMLDDAGYMKGNPSGLQQEIQRRLEISNQTLTNSGIKTMMEGCDQLFKISNFK